MRINSIQKVGVGIYICLILAEIYHHTHPSSTFSSYWTMFRGMIVLLMIILATMNNSNRKEKNT